MRPSSETLFIMFVFLLFSDQDIAQMRTVFKMLQVYINPNRKIIFELLSFDIFGMGYYSFI